MICLATVALSGACVTLHTPPGTVAPDRPGFSDTPIVLPGGALQIEAGYTADRSSSETYHAIGESLLRVGIGAGTELRIFGNSVAIRHPRSLGTGASVTGLEDAKLGAKVRLMAGGDSVRRWIPASALVVASTIATGRRGIGAGAAQQEAKIALAWALPAGWSMTSDVGGSRVYDGEKHLDRVAASSALWYAVDSRLSLFGEYLETSTRSVARRPGWTDAGAAYVINDRVQVDLRAGRGVAGGANDSFVGIGIGRRW